MLRTARSIEAGTVYHVLNRGNGRMRLLHKDCDYEAFERVLTEGFSRYPADRRPAGPPIHSPPSRPAAEYPKTISDVPFSSPRGSFCGLNALVVLHYSSDSSLNG